MAASSCAAAMDPGTLVDQFLFWAAKIQRTYKDYELIRVRDKATSKELNHVLKIMAKHLHPDKGELARFAVHQYPDIDQDTLQDAQEILRDFWTTWQNTLHKLQELDDGYYQKDPLVYMYMYCICVPLQLCVLIHPCHGSYVF
jgi:hypothetical protein